MEADASAAFPSLAGSGITVEPQHFDLLKDQTYCLDKLEKLVISSTVTEQCRNQR